MRPKINCSQTDKAPMRCVVLLSGGLDSATVLAMAQAEGREVFAMSFDYGQKQSVELEKARSLAKQASCILHRVVTLSPSTFEGSALVDPDMNVPKKAGASDAIIPCTYVPARNLLFLSYALAWAEVVGAEEIHIGVNAVDYSGYPDCRPEFIKSFEACANLATAAAVQGRFRFKISATHLTLSKAEIIQCGTELGVDYAATHSCYDPDSRGRACGLCDACFLRKEGFAQANVSDPTLYAL